MYEESLKQAGLTPDQARVYEALLKNGSMPAGKVSTYASLKRGLTYKILEQLEASGLITKKEEKGKVATFEAAHPLRLKEIAETKEKDAKNAQVALEGVLGGLISDFNLVSGKPGITFYEGTEGAGNIYDDTIFNNDKKEILVFRSHLDDKTLGSKFFETYSSKRASKDIKTKIISPSEISGETAEKDKKFLKERRRWPDLEIPAEIDIYDNKVAIIAFENKIIGTIINNSSVAETLRKIFHKVWESLEEKTDQNDLPSK